MQSRLQKAHGLHKCYDFNSAFTHLVLGVADTSVCLTSRIRVVARASASFQRVSSWDCISQNNSCDGLGLKNPVEEGRRERPRLTEQLRESRERSVVSKGHPE